MKRSLQFRTAVGLFLPVLLLLSAGWWFSNKRTPTQAISKTSLILGEIQVVNPAPIERIDYRGSENIRIRINIKLPRAIWTPRQKKALTFRNSFLKTAEGRKIPAPDPYLGDISLRSKNSHYVFHENDEGIYRCEVEIPLSLITANDDVYVTEVSLDKEPPLKIQVPFMRDLGWMKKKSTLLKLEKIYTGIAVEVLFSYKGQKPLSLRYNGVGLLWGEMYRSNGREYKLIPSGPGKMRFFSNWSEHLEDAAGRTYWITPPITQGNSTGWSNRVWAKEVTFDEETKTGSVLYQIMGTGSLPPKGALWFKGKIGLEGDGFLPIKVQVRDVNGKWL